MPGTDGMRRRDDRSEISGFFGDLTRAVALGAPITHVELCSTLDRLGAAPPADCPVVTAPDATVHFVSAAEWHRHATARDLKPAHELAAREVHRRMADALGAPALPPRSDPYVVPE